MTTKEKAIELINKFDGYKHYAEWVVDEIIIALEEHAWQNRLLILWYQEVKQEIQNL